MAETKAPASALPPEGVYNEKRRTQRVHITMPVIVRGKNGEQPFEEEASTISMNANGCMLLLVMPVKRAQHVSIVNPKTAEELPCSVVYLGKKIDGKTQVGLEFSEPSPLFWRIAFPPEDWDPSERKLPTTHAQRPRETPRR